MDRITEWRAVGNPGGVGGKYESDFPRVDGIGPLYSSRAYRRNSQLYFALSRTGVAPIIAPA